MTLSRYLEGVVDAVRGVAQAVWASLSGANGSGVQLFLASVLVATAGIFVTTLGRRWLLVRRHLADLRLTWLFNGVRGRLADGTRLSVMGRVDTRRGPVPGAVEAGVDVPVHGAFSLTVHPGPITSIPNRFVDDPALDARIDADGDLVGLLRVLDTEAGRAALRALVGVAPAVALKLEAGQVAAAVGTAATLDDFLRSDAEVEAARVLAAHVKQIAKLLEEDARRAGEAPGETTAWTSLRGIARVAIPVVGVGGGYVALVLGVATERVSPGAIMPIIGATFFVGIIGLLLWSELPKRIVRDSALRALEDAFKTSARRHGDVVALDFVRDGHPVHLEVSTNRRGLLGKVVPFFVVRTRARARFQLSAEGYVRALKSAVGIDDILTGDAAFDDAAHLRGHPETTRSYFSHPDVRAAASTLLRDDLCRSLSLDDSGDLRVTTKVRVASDATETVLAQHLEATVGRATALARVLESVSGVVVETLPRASVALGGDESSVAVPALTTTASSR